MGTAFAPGLSRNGSRAWAARPLTSLICVCAVISGAAVFAQDAKTKAGDEKKAAAAPSKKGSPEAPPPAPPPTKEELAKSKAESEARAAAMESSFETVFDPNAEAAMRNVFPELRDVSLSENEVNQLLVMSGGGRLDPNLIDRYVRHFAADLTKRANIEAVMKQDSKSPNARKIAEAGVRLQEPIRNAERNNPVFMAEYRKSLLKAAPDLLKGHLYARVQAIIPLAMSRSAEAIPIFLAQIRDPKQALAVKVWALRGVSLLADHGRNEAAFRGQNQALAVETIVQYMKANPALPWYVKIRAVEALGSLRQASSNIRSGKADSAEVILANLADPKQRPELRAWSGWAMGMMRVPAEIRDYNHTLAAWHLGRCVADLGQETDKVFELRVAQDDEETDKKKQIKETLVYNAERVSAFANLIAVQLYRGFNGETGLRDSGLSNAATGTHSAAVRNMESRVREVAKAIVELERAAGALVPEARQALSAAVADLNEHLSRSRPSDWSLTPNGERFPGAAPSVAGNSR